MKIYIEKVKNHSVCLTMLIILIAMTVWNYTTPLIADDEYMTHTSLGEINHQLINDYFTWNGRIVGQFIFKMLVHIPLPIESFLNAIVFVSLSLLILLISKINKNDINTVNYIFTIIILAGLMSAFSQIYIWRAGSGNYMWTTTIDLLLIFLIKSNLIFKTKIRNTLYIIAITILGFISGETNENTVGGVIIIIIFYILFEKLDIRKYIFPLLSTITGYLILLLSPGEWQRAKIQNPNFLKLNIFEKIDVNFKPLLNAIYINEKYIIILFAILFILNLIFIKSYRLLIESSCWFITGLLVSAVLLLSAGGITFPRTYFGSFIFMTVATVKLFNVSTINYKLNILSILLIMLLGIGTIYKLSIGIVDSYKSNQAMNQRNSYIMQEKRKGKKIVEVKPLNYVGTTKYSISYQYTELSKDPGFWVNGCVGHRFNVIVKLKN